MTMRKRTGWIALVALIAASAIVSAEDANFRNILEIDAVITGSDEYFVRTENVLIWKRSPRFLPTFRVTGTTNRDESRLLAQPGFVWVFKEGVYADVSYGVSTNGNLEPGQEGFAEITRETDETVMSARFKAGYLHENRLFYMIPDASFKRYFTELYALRAKYFFGFNTDDFRSHSLELSNDFAISKRITLSGIGVGTWERYGYGDEWLWGAGVKAHATITERVKLRYLLQYNTLARDRWGIENAITLDVKF